MGESASSLMDDPALEARKAEARRRARAVRSVAVDAEAGRMLAVLFPPALRERAAGLTVAGYWPVGSEIDPRPLMASLRRAEARIVLPRMRNRRDPPEFCLWAETDDLAPDAFGMLAPKEEAPLLQPDLVLTPLLAFDRAGARLGQGGGHYDRILAGLKPQGVVAVGLAFAAQELDDLPMGPQDQRLDWIVTEKEAIMV
jgi:5-formyltetrahydrofolate cyclo-ligase